MDNDDVWEKGDGNQLRIVLALCPHTIQRILEVRSAEKGTGSWAEVLYNDGNGGKRRIHICIRLSTPGAMKNCGNIIAENFVGIAGHFRHVLKSGQEVGN